MALLMLMLAGLVMQPVQAGDASLYQRLGGNAVLTGVVNDTLDQVVKDPRLNRSFDGVNMTRLKQHVVLFLCSLTGGGCVWEGDTMKQAHGGLAISEAEMYGFVQVFSDALDRHGVGLREKNELLALLAPMKRDIVSRP